MAASVMLVACGSPTVAQITSTSSPDENPMQEVTTALAAAATATAPAAAAVFQPATPTFVPTAISSPTQAATQTPVATSTPTSTPTATPIGPCEQRLPSDPLLAIITLQYGISREFVPEDLVPLSDLLPPSVTLGYPTEIREIVSGPLVAMIGEMRAAGLEPMIISGYRSYSAQAIAWTKWVTTEPDRASILSAPPGYSEHQLGTTLDFGSPELPEIVGDEQIQFHTYFYMTSESKWLEENAHKYGFTLSYPRQAFELTGFYYEPWHYRYVGVELATQLKESGSFLTQYQLERQPIPCIP